MIELSELKQVKQKEIITLYETFDLLVNDLNKISEDDLVALSQDEVNFLHEQYLSLKSVIENTRNKNEEHLSFNKLKDLIKVWIDLANQLGHQNFVMRFKVLDDILAVKIKRYPL